ncbi:FtsK/SpoIIIE family DNA translocase [Caldisalinibacter kiritimatiensis]|uniref:Cell division protein FtsK n=1 Tax=Caldisalinibacter kiritimatiensis TaxID=1304284 RepID=R1CRD3_9FIRM|nr:DNA translocase FtsK [Caldisalinibacter kiritimatiensis]EOD01241.1 Cell division protein FtsK [Caldisalinibacter kiritimatiensis]
MKAKSAKRKKKKNKNKDLNKEIIGIIIISLGILALFSMHSASTGYVGDFIENKFKVIAGFGSFLLPYIILFIGILFSLNKLKLKENKRSISLVIIFLCFLIFLHINYFNKVEIDEKTAFIELLNDSIKAGELAKGGGIIGALFSYLTLKLFGVVGTYILIVCLTLISFLNLTNISIVEIMRKFFGVLKKIVRNSLKSIKDFVYVDKKEDKKEEIYEEEKIKVNVKNNIENIQEVDKNRIEEKIKILDFTNELKKKEDKKERNTDFEKNDISIDKDRNGNNSEDNISFEVLETQGYESIESYKLPETKLLRQSKYKKDPSEKKEILNKANRLEETLSNFGIKANVIQISKGPSITRFELQPAPGVKVSRIVNLTNDIALSLASSDIRIEAPIPGKSAIGIEVPNQNKAIVSLREIFESDEFEKVDTKIPFALGKDIAGKPIVTNIEKMPHLLIAGATGSGKSVCINTLITSILFKAKPDEVKLLLIDPKVVELSVYNGIPHLLIPVVTDPKKAAGALNWAVQEMTKRYNLFAKFGVRDIFSYNNKANVDEEIEKLPQIVVIIDELADLMMVSPGEVEDSICRLAQMARAAGIHLIIATQRPSVDVITGTIKANIPSRIAFSVSSQADSRTILDMGGAEKLLGKGDMLFYPVGASKPKRIQGAYIDEKEVEKIVNYLKEQSSSNYQEEIIDDIEKEVSIDSDNSDDLLPKAIELVVEEGQASISYLQRKLRIGYARAARLIDDMEERGIVGGHEGSKPRKVLISKDDLDNLKEN